VVAMPLWPCFEDTLPPTVSSAAFSGDQATCSEHRFRSISACAWEECPPSLGVGTVELGSACFRSGTVLKRQVAAIAVWMLSIVTGVEARCATHTS